MIFDVSEFLYLRVGKAYQSVSALVRTITRPAPISTSAASIGLLKRTVTAAVRARDTAAKISPNPCSEA
jgi:hypothetical protein